MVARQERDKNAGIAVAHRQRGIGFAVDGGDFDHAGESRRRAAGAAATPPTTSAPSLPMIIRPMRAGSAVQSAVRISGAARVSVFCHENQLPKAPWYISAKASSGSTCA